MYLLRCLKWLRHGRDTAALDYQPDCAVGSAAPEHVAGSGTGAGR